MVIRPAAASVREVDKKSQQANKIKEIGYALVVSGFACLDQQAKALGISRSTAWTILNARHKTSGLSALVINQMLKAPHLPPLVRAKLIEYVEEKIAGVYGHNAEQVRRFAARLVIRRWRSNSKFDTKRGIAKHNRHELDHIVQIGHGHIVESSRRMKRSTELIQDIERKIATSIGLIERSRPRARIRRG